MPYRVVVLDTDDMTVKDVAANLEELLNSFGKGARVMNVIPMTQSYSRPDPDSSYRDFHYRDHGILVVVEEKEPRK